jgi:uncharacterized protein (DUF305 family)
MNDMLRIHARELATALLLSAAAACASGPARGPQTATRQTPIANPADVRFMSGMIGHHAQALHIARWAESHGASASIRTLAGRIMNAQQDEIRLMQQWLRDHNQPVPQVDSTGHGAHGGDRAHHHQMPGMLTDAQLKQLDEAKGADFDRLFLQLMIQHHRGATEMVKELTNSQGAALDDTVFKLAADINVDQITEINRMQRMLATMVIGIPDP